MMELVKGQNLNYFIGRGMHQAEDQVISFS